MSAKDKMVKAVAARKGVAPSKEQKKPLPKDALSYTEMRHYEPEFSAADAKWLVLGRMHVQVWENASVSAYVPIFLSESGTPRCVGQHSGCCSVGIGRLLSAAPFALHVVLAYVLLHPPGCVPDCLGWYHPCSASFVVALPLRCLGTHRDFLHFLLLHGPNGYGCANILESLGDCCFWHNRTKGWRREGM